MTIKRAARPLLAAAALCLFVSAVWHRKAPAPPLDISLWYWHQPFRLSRAELLQLDSMGVHQLFVRAGTITRARDAVRISLPQQWENRGGAIPVHLVFNF